MARFIVGMSLISALVACGGPECDPGDARCQGGRPQTCIGERWVDEGTDCGLVGNVCQYCEESLFCRETASCVPPLEAHCHCSL